MTKRHKEARPKPPDEEPQTDNHKQYEYQEPERVKLVTDGFDEMEFLNGLGMDGWQVYKVNPIHRDSKIIGPDSNPIKERGLQCCVRRVIGSKTKYFYKVHSKEVMCQGPDLNNKLLAYFNELGAQGWDRSVDAAIVQMPSTLSDNTGPIPRFMLQILAAKEY